MSEEVLVALAFWTMIAFPIAVFLRLVVRARSGLISRTKATRRFFGVSIAPVLVYLGFFVAATGIEEVAGFALVTEGYARTLLLVVGVVAAWVVVLTALFAATLRVLASKSGVTESDAS